MTEQDYKDIDEFELRARASDDLGCTCDACLNIARKEVEDEKRTLSEELLKKINRHDPDFISGLVEDSIGLYLEYIHAHGKSEDEAKVFTVTEVLDSLDYSYEKDEE